MSEFDPNDNRASNETVEMSEVATLGNIFFEPERTFKALKAKPRFILVTLITVILASAFTFAFNQKVGEEGYRREFTAQLDKNPQTAAMSSEDKARTVDTQVALSKYSPLLAPVAIIIFSLIGALLYWGGSKAFGGEGGFLHSLSVWFYSGFPAAVISLIGNLIVMYFKSADEIDIGASQRGLLQANLGFLFGKDTSAVLVTLVSVLDLFAIWGWILAAIGLRVTNKISSGSAWAVVILVALIGVLFRVIGAFFSGNPS
ncbi:MAG: YIP1 family protein [Acidobacteria bacterium]|nr:YIP1 family protein [Acidobacteriota bacterium]